MNSGYLHLAAEALKRHYDDADEIESIVIRHAVASAASGVASGFIPGAGGAIASVAAFGFTLSMYIRICKELNLSLGKNILRGIASVFIAEIAAFLAVWLGAFAVISFVPGIGNVSAALVDGVMAFAMVYIAGVIFLILMEKIGKENIDISSITEEEFKDMAKECAKEADIKSIYKEAKKTYSKVKDDEQYKDEDIKPEE